MPDPSDLVAVHAALLVFARIAAALFTAPAFGASAVPPQVRILLGVVLAGALTGVLSPHVPGVPPGLGGLVLQVGTEVTSGVLIGLAMTLAVQAAQIAGSLLDIQIGLSMSQILNPVDGVPVTILGQFKNLLALVVFLTLDGHHLVIEALVRSYSGPGLSMDSLPQILTGVQTLVGTALVTALTIAAPALGVSLVVDAALGLLSRAVPQLQPLQIGMPAKIGAGLLAVAFALPALVGAVAMGLNGATHAIGRLFGGA